MHVALAVALCALPARSRDGNLTGTFETGPSEGGSKNCTEIQCENAPAPASLRQSVVITGEGVTLKTPFGGIAMTYTSHGDYLLGKTVLSDGEMYYPIYVQDENTVILSGEKYVRVQAV
ncbi:MAG: hypothetical protein EOP84_34360, partial [Verrucomicrobiaceae bacterium]